MRRHDAGCAVLGAWCEEMGCHLEAGQKPWGEVLVPWAAPARQEARMDLVVHAPGVASPFYVDLTVANTLSAVALAGGSPIRTPGTLPRPHFPPDHSPHYALTYTSDALQRPRNYSTNGDSVCTHGTHKCWGQAQFESPRHEFCRPLTCKL